MRNKLRLLALAAGAVLIASLTMLLLSAPGFLSDRDSTVPIAASAREAAR